MKNITVSEHEEISVENIYVLDKNWYKQYKLAKF